MPFAIVRDDITHVRADALVNAANEQLRQGGGVCGAIFRAAGARKLQAACNKIGHCDTGSAVATPAFGLHARHVIHAVGPIWQGGTHGERALLASCYRTALELADSLGCRSVAFPLISAGIYGYPRREALVVAQEQIRAFLDTHEMDVTLVLYDASVMEIADDLRLRVARYIDDVYVSAHAASQARHAWEEHAKLPPNAQLGQALHEEVQEAAPGSPTSTCPVCGASVAEDALFCIHCGHRLDGSEAPEQFDAVEALGSIPNPVSCEDTGALLAAASSAPASAPAPDLYAGTMAPPAGAKPTRKRRVHAPSLPNPLRNLLDHLDAGFSETLLAMIDERGLKDAQVYKRANISRQHFSKIRSNPGYRPTKTTVLALAVALELSLADTQTLLERAGFALSHADRRDVIVEFFIREGIYDIFQINDVLFSYDQPLLG